MGYIRKDLTLNLKRVNIVGTLLMIPIVSFFIILHLCLNSNKVSLMMGPWTGVVFVLSMVLLTVLHEWIHGCTWAMNAEHHFQSLSFGEIWSMLALCMILGACGDFMIVMKMIRHKEGGSHVIYMDHPYECGVVVFEQL